MGRRSLQPFTFSFCIPGSEVDSWIAAQSLALHGDVSYPVVHRIIQHLFDKPDAQTMKQVCLILGPLSERTVCKRAAQTMLAPTNMLLNNHPPTKDAESGTSSILETPKWKGLPCRLGVFEKELAMKHVNVRMIGPATESFRSRDVNRR